MTDEPEKPKPLDFLDAFEAKILMSILGNFVSLIRVRNEDFFEKPDERVLWHCDQIKEKFGIVCDTGFSNYVEAVKALTEFEKKYGLREIEVPGPLEFCDSERLSYFYDDFENTMERYTFCNHAIHRDLLTLILKAVYSLH